MSKKTYYEMLKDERWQNRRLEIFNRDKFICRRCGYESSYEDFAGENDEVREFYLEVHHIKYIYGLKPWEYPENLLVTLCENCHAKIERVKKIVGHNPPLEEIIKRSVWWGYL
jgi:5-methylcytosine-specific restriction endonuclease McrA